jgi:hypothetical protein
MSLKNIELCDECGYRLLCKDCRAVEKSSTNELKGKKYCSKEYINKRIL